MLLFHDFYFFLAKMDLDTSHGEVRKCKTGLRIDVNVLIRNRLDYISAAYLNNSSVISDICQLITCV